MVKNELSLNAIKITIGDDPQEWVKLIPAGDIKGMDGREYRNIIPDKVVQTFIYNGIDLPVDVEHASERQLIEQMNNPNRAIGWIKELENRQGEIWGKMDWNESGIWLIRSKSYRYISPAFWHTKDRIILKLSSVAITKTPNFKMPALNNKLKQEEEGEFENMKSVCKALGLDQDASEGEILVAINSLKDASKPDKIVGKEEYNKAIARAEAAEQSLQTVEKASHEKGVETAINAALEAGKITPASVDYHKSVCSTKEGLESFKTLMENAQPIISQGAGHFDKSAASAEVSGAEIVKYV